MDDPVLIIDMPKLETEAVIECYDFLQALVNAFETHHRQKLQDYWSSHRCDDDIPF